MIAEFTIENFRSFKEKNTFSLVATNDKELSESNTFEGKRNRFLKSAIIYGANASGKSNFFNALVFFFNFSVHSGPRKQDGDPTDSVPFILSKQTESRPSSFEIIFFVPGERGETRYRYGFTVDKEQVHEEYLLAIYNMREVTLFSRNFQQITYSSYFKEGARSKTSVRTNCTFLSVCAQHNGTISKEIITYFRNFTVLFGSSALEKRILSDNKPKQENKKARIQFLKYADIQVTDVSTELKPIIDDIQLPDDNAITTAMKNMYAGMQIEKVKFGHPFYDEEKQIGERYMDEQDESAGTQKLHFYSEFILRALETGNTLFIDEFDIMLHPIIIEHIFNIFNSVETNPKNAQLIVSSHSVTLMTNKSLRRDQIWFCEKDQYGATDLYSLAEYKVRSDATYNKDYLRGKYGAVPSLGNFLPIGFEE